VRFAERGFRHRLRAERQAERVPAVRRRLRGLCLAGHQDRVTREDRYRRGAHGEPRNLTPDDPGQRDGVIIQPLAKPHRAQPRLSRLPPESDRLVNGVAVGIRHCVGDRDPYVHVCANPGRERVYSNSDGFSRL
jgi:hypothetical protein